MKRTPALLSAKSFILLAGLILIGLASCGPEENQGVANRQFVPQNVAGWEVQDSVRTFDRQTIFDYINGAGEVYLSYGFREVTEHRFQREGSPEITVEIFDMGSTEDAYGVFTYARESESEGIGQAYEYRGSVLCFWQDRYYVCVTCYEQTAETKEVLPELARQISGRLPDGGTRPGLVDVLPPEQRVEHSERFFHLHSSLNYHYFVARENLLNMGPETRAVMARYTPGSVRLLCVQYPEAPAASAGYRGFADGFLPESETGAPVQMENSLWTGVRQIDRYVIVVFDATTEEQAEQLLNGVETNLSTSTQ